MTKQELIRMLNAYPNKDLSITLNQDNDHHYVVQIMIPMKATVVGREDPLVKQIKEVNKWIDSINWIDKAALVFALLWGLFWTFAVTLPWGLEWFVVGHIILIGVIKYAMVSRRAKAHSMYRDLTIHAAGMYNYVYNSASIRNSDTNFLTRIRTIRQSEFSGYEDTKKLIATYNSILDELEQIPQFKGYLFNEPYKERPKHD